MKIDLKDAKCTKLSFGATVNLARSEDEVTGFELDGYTGAVVDRWWGKLAIDLDGIMAKQQMPVFRGHDHSQIVGYSTKTTRDTSFKVQGVFSKHTDAAKEVMATAAEGFPWQASIGVSPKIVTELKAGVSMIVNGSELVGPAEVWTESEVYETSFVPLGADGNTSATVFSNVQEVAEAAERKRPIAATNKEGPHMNLDELREKHSDLVALIKNEALADLEEKEKLAKEAGREEERLRIKAVHAQSFPGHEDLVTAAMFDGKSQPGDVAMQINAANIKAARVAGEEMSSDAPDAVDEPLKKSGQDAIDDELPIEDKCGAEWKLSKSLRAEFNNDLDSYVAFKVAEEDKAFKYLKNKE